MTHAFNDILRRRDRRRLRLARAAFLLRRSRKWMLAFAVTLLVLLILAGIAEGGERIEGYSLWRRFTSMFRGQAGFEWPWTWYRRLTGEGDRAIAPGTGALLVLFVGGWLTLIGIALLRWVLRFGYGPLAVARSVLDEAIRNKTVVVLLAMLLIALAAWPYSTTSAAAQVMRPLRYQIQSFLSFSSLATATLLGAVTILFSAHSVSTDINVRRTGDVFVKPIRRPVYLLGKWIGVVSMMAVILAVQTMLVWGVARLWLGTNYALDPTDAAAINQHVLIARGESLPMPPVPLEQLVAEKFESIERDQPELVRRRGRTETIADLFVQERSNFLSVPYNTRKEYVFAGLGSAKRNAERLERQIAANADELARQLSELTGSTVRPAQISLEFLAPYAGVLGIDLQPALLQWRFQVKGTGNSYGSARGALDVSINGRGLSVPLDYTIERVQILDLPATYVDDNGMLILELGNVYPDTLGRQRTIQFDADTWMQIYYVEGGFAPNLARGAVIQMVRLAFLGMLGVVTGALWSYPVAATFSLSVWLLAAGGSWLQQTLAARVAETDVVPVDAAFNSALLPVVRLIASFLSRYSTVNVNSLLVEGRYISSLAVVNHVYWIGIIWTGVLLALGGYLFSRREIARVQV